MGIGNRKGFTLIEVIVVAGIIAILAGILVPLIFKEIDESRISRAKADVHSISTAIYVLRKDSGQWPVNASCTPGVTLLRGAGTDPTFEATWDSSNAAEFDSYFLNDASECWVAGQTWKGPYMAGVTADPWGKRYVLNAKDFESGNPVWLVSAGPNGVIDTTIMDTDLQIDDVGLRIK